MNKKIITLKHTTIVATVLSAIFLFFNWFTISIPVLESFLESGSVSLSFFTLPALIEESAVGLITRMGGKGTAAMTLVLCGILKYMCILSAGLGLYGIWKICIKGEKSRLIFTSQVIALGLQVLSFLIILIVNIFMSMYSGNIAAAMNIQQELLDFSFIPTVWLCLSTISAIVSLVASNRYSKESE